jgi:LCP family protein required for cell wall assembly
MKKPIDPNLINKDEDEIFQDLDIKGTESKLASMRNSGNKSEPHFEINEDYVSVQEIMDEIEEQPLGINESKSKDSDVAASSSSDRHHHHHHHHHHQHHNHHSRSSSRKRKKKEKLPVAARIAIIILICLLGIVALAVLVFLGMRTWGHLDMMKKTDAQGEPLAYQETIEYKGHTYKYNDDMLSMAFLGIDQRTMKNVKQTDFVGASDADIVVAINTKTGETKVISVPRDTMVDVDIWSTSGIFLRTQKTQLCLAYAYGDGGNKSCANAVTSISRVLYNVPIQKYYALDLDGIKKLNDAIGGVTVNALYSLPEYGIKYGDTVTLVGDMAEAYVRTRDMDDIEASLNRSERQIQYVKAFAEQALPAVVKDFSTISRLYNTADKYSQKNITLNNATYLGSLLLSKGVTEFKTYSIKGTMKAADDPLIPDVVYAEFYPDEDQLMEVVLDVFYTQID